MIAARRDGGARTTPKNDNTNPEETGFMRTFVFALVAAAFATPAFAQDAPAAQSASQAQMTPDQVMDQFKSDLQAKRADIMAKGMTLDADQAAKFWPLYEKFQQEQDAIITEQLKVIEAYAQNYATLTDADSLAFVNAQLTRDQKMHDLRVKWLAKFQTVLPGGLAARDPARSPGRQRRPGGAVGPDSARPLTGGGGALRARRRPSRTETTCSAHRSA